MPRTGIPIEVLTVSFNQLRTDCKNEMSLSQDTLVELFKMNNIPYSCQYFAAYTKYGILTKVAVGRYVFPVQPIYRGVIEKAFKEVREYKTNSYYKKIGKDKELDLTDKIQESIDFLKSQGFLVLKQM